MGNPCSSGVGAPNPGNVGIVSFLTNIAVSTFLRRIGLGWLAAVIGALPQFAFDVDDFCPDGQPALPVITAEDVLALVAPLANPNAGAAGEKVRELILYYLWYELCHCVSVTTPSPPAVQAPPSVIAYGVPSGTPCMDPPAATRTYHRDFVNGSQACGLWWRVSASPVPDYGISTTVAPRTVRLVLDRVRSATGVHEDPMKLKVEFAPNIDVNMGTAGEVSELIDVPGDHFDRTFIVPAGMFSFQACVKPTCVGSDCAVNENTNDILTFKFYAYCDTLPIASDEVCCPPDPSISAAIAELAAQLQIVKSDVQLVQRQAAPFAFLIQPTIHGLTGNGFINVSGLLGCLIQLEALPDHYGIVDAEIMEIYTDSWINWGSATYASPKEWIRGGQQLSFPRNAGLYTRIFYTLRPGIVVGISPIVREP